MVHVLDDDKAIRNSLEMLLKSALMPARMYGSAKEFIDGARLDRPGCLVLDLRLPGMGGLELLQQLRAWGSAMSVIVMSGYGDVPTVVKVMNLGAADFLEKPFDPNAMLSAVRRSLTSSRAGHKKWLEEQSIRNRLCALTRRELDLLKQVVAGKSSKEIAAGMRISIKTVANHRASLMAKMGAANAADLTRLSVLAGIEFRENCIN